MVRAILEGRKTQTRRIVKNLDYIQDYDPNDPTYGPFFEDEYGESCKTIEACPYGQPGDRLWVKETYVADIDFDHLKPSEIPIGSSLDYLSVDIPFLLGKTRPSIFMCRWMSQIDLEVINIRVERLQNISAEDCITEGLSTTLREHDAVCDLEDQFKSLWDSINGRKNPWESNPWVWVVEFKQTKGGVN